MWHPPSGGLGLGSGGGGERGSPHGSLSQQFSLTTAGRWTVFTVTEGLKACHPRSARRLSGLNPLVRFEHGSEEHTGKGCGGERGLSSFSAGGDWPHALCVCTWKSRNSSVWQSCVSRKWSTRQKWRWCRFVWSASERGGAPGTWPRPVHIDSQLSRSFQLWNVSYLWARRLREQRGSPKCTPRVRRSGSWKYNRRERYP